MRRVRQPIAKSLLHAGGLVAVCAVALLAMAASASAEDGGDGGLEVVGGAEARNVELQTCPTQSAGAEPAHTCTKTEGRPYRGGELTVLVRNGGSQTAELEVQYLRDRGGPPISLPGSSEEEAFLLEDKRPTTTADLSLEAEARLPLSIGFALPVDESASALDGVVVVSATGEKPLALPVKGEARSFEEVTVAPSTLPIDASDGDGVITLGGPELVEYLRSYGGEETAATLYRDDGETAKATLTLPTAGEAGEGSAATSRVEAAVTLSGSPEAGKYTGKLALPGLPADSGTITIELQQHRSCVSSVLIFIGMLALVLLGILLTGFATRIVTMASRRKLLTNVLSQTYDAFAYVVKRQDEHGNRLKIASWTLDDLLGEDPATEEEPKPQGERLQGLPALRESIETARSSADLDEDAERVLDMVARMQRWLRVEPLARQLALVAGFDPGGGLPKDSEETEDGKTKELDALMWHDSRTLRDTRALLEMARREPADAEKADDLVARLMFQIEWHRKMAAAWKAAREAEQHLKRSREIRALEKALGDESKVGTRDIGEQDGLSAQLQGVVEQHENDVHPRDIGDIEGEEIDAKGGALGITPVVWQASPNLFTGWATLDGPSYGQLARRAATSSRARYMPGWDAIGREAGSFDRADAGWTLAILLFAAVTYGTTTYSENWGSAKDLATAFLAGSLGKATIDWAALPIFQSVRLRKAAKD